MRFFQALLITTLLLSHSLAHGDTIYNLNFEGSNTTDFDQTGGDAPATISKVNSDGVGGSNGYVLAFDTTSGPFSTAINGNLQESTIVNTPTSTSASDYVFSFDARIEGLLDGQSVSVEARYITDLFQAGESTYTHNFTPTSTFQNFSFTLGTGILDPADFLLGQRFQATILGTTEARFGLDNNNRLIFDNILITQAVPEPSSVALVGILGLSGFIRRRKKTS